MVGFSFFGFSKRVVSSSLGECLRVINDEAYAARC